MKYYISDTHFFSMRAIKIGNRPFKYIQEMNDALIKNWNKTVTKNDEVYIVGDFISSINMDDANKIINSLHGKKHLIIGNHDDFLHDKDLKNKFESISEILETEDNGKRIVLSHYPMAIWPKQHLHSLHFYGHIHNIIIEQEIILTIPEAYNVSADILGLTPRTMEEVIHINNSIQNPLREKNNIKLSKVFYLHENNKH